MSKKKSKKNKKASEDKSTILAGKLFGFTKQRYIVWTIVLAIFLLRIIYLFELSKNDPLFYHPLPGTDQDMYYQSAYQILNGEFPMSVFGYNPLYYYFLALCLKIADCNLFGVRIIQVLLGAGTCILTYLMGKRLFNYQVGLISLILSGICGTLMFHDGILLSTTLTTFLCSLCLFLLIRLMDKFNKRDLIISGISFGLAVLSQPNVILFLPFVLLWLFFALPISKKRGILICSIFALVFFLTISPVTIRNYIASGKFILLTTAGPFQFWLGNNEHAPGIFDFCQPYLEEIQNKSQKEGRDLYIEDVLRFIKKNPIAFTKLQIKKLLLFWGDYDIPHQVGYDSTKKLSFLLNIFPGFGIIVILGIIGMLFSLKNWKKFTLLYLFVLVYSFSVIGFLVVGRYRPPILPILIIFASFTLKMWYEKIRLRQYKTFILSISLVILLIPFVYIRELSGVYHTIKYPTGTLEKTEDGWQLCDYSDDMALGVELSSSDQIIKKEFIIGKDIPKAKELYIGVVFNCNNSGMLKMKFNEYELPQVSFAQLYEATRSIVGGISFGPIPSNLLKENKNVVTIEVAEGGYINTQVSKAYKYGRSFVSKDKGKTWQKVAGEYMISLEGKKD